MQRDGVQQLDPVAADEQAPIVRFFEQAFEWDQMSYVLEPYFWGRTASWALRQRLAVPDDPKHEAFLRAGSARVIVPVTAGYEARVLAYLDSEPSLPEWQQDQLDYWDPDDPQQRIPPTARDLSTTSSTEVLLDTASLDRFAIGVKAALLDPRPARSTEPFHPAWRWFRRGAERCWLARSRWPAWAAAQLGQDRPGLECGDRPLTAGADFAWARFTALCRGDSIGRSGVVDRGLLGRTWLV